MFRRLIDWLLGRPARVTPTQLKRVLDRQTIPADVPFHVAREWLGGR